MSLAEIKAEVRKLNEEDRAEIAATLVELQRENDTEWQDGVVARIRSAKAGHVTSQDAVEALAGEPGGD